ncbi:hypothetical protein [Clostridium massiliamazoniense]|uniref:hypothetical protein n=1 Tax=Clostridium massiliamazoniense TaxID=1347366 RepID=UPI0006D787DE|nr:hypothetical protein [Clostridium massiliamazoniense]
MARNKNTGKYAVMETICTMGEGVETNLCAICNTRDEAIEVVSEYRKKHLLSRMNLVTSEEYEEYTHTDLDTVFDYMEDEYEYHLLACTPRL